MNRAIASFLFLAAACHAPPGQTVVELHDTASLDVRDVDVAFGEHADRRGLRVREREQGAGDTFVVIPDIEFEDGVIELELSGAPRADAAPNMRGFVGVAFRMQDEPQPSYECFYLRPTNGRATEQLRRNHATQYIAVPGYPWHRLRNENPGEYESYVDLAPGTWTRVRIEVAGTTARLFVHGADQPCLVVHDLKHGRRSGQVALWLGMGTEAWFRALRITPAENGESDASK